MAETIFQKPLDAQVASNTDAITNLQKNNLGVRVAIGGYNSTSNLYTFPSDGYVRAYSYNNTTNVFLVGSSGSTAGTDVVSFSVTSVTSNNMSNSIFVRKGMKCYCSAANSTDVYFHPLT